LFRLQQSKRQMLPTGTAGKTPGWCPSNHYFRGILCRVKQKNPRPVAVLRLLGYPDAAGVCWLRSRTRRLIVSTPGRAYEEVYMRGSLGQAMAALLLLAPFTAGAQYAWFARNTDTIAVSGQTELSDQCTIEAVFMLPGNSHSGGSIFSEWVLGQEEKHLGISLISVGAVAFPNNYLEAVERRGLLSLDMWHHVAVVWNGNEQRIYLNGLRIQSGPAFQRIGNGPGEAFIGFAPREGTDLPGFVGYLDSVRVSKVARYAGLSFTAPVGDLPSDDHTLLLFNFNDPLDKPTIQDESSLARTGTLGGALAPATAPKIVGKLPTEVPLGLRIFPAVEIQFPTTLGATYQLQSSPDMAVWTDMPEFITGDGQVLRKLISTQGNGRLFYRAVTRP
jgi:hypothetical protein